MDNAKILEKLGMSQNETKIYISCLEIGRAPVSNIAKRSNIKRTTLYPILDEMSEKSYLKKYSQNGVVSFEAIPPETLHQDFVRRVSDFEKKLPDFQALNNTSARKPKISYYDGLENVIKIYEMEVADSPIYTKVLSATIDHTNEQDMTFKRLRNKVFAWGNKSPYYKKWDMYIILNRPILPGELSWRIFHGKSIPQNILDIRTTVKIYEDKVIFISTQDGFQGVVIENRNIAQTMESLFDYIFEGKSPVVEQVPPETKSKNKRKKQ